MLQLFSVTVTLYFASIFVDSEVIHRQEKQQRGCLIALK